MQLSQRVGIGLKRLGNQNLISDDSFKKLVDAAPEVILKTKNSSKINLNELCASKGDVVKESFSSLLILLVESARHDLDSKVLIATLENYNFNPDRLNKIAIVYDNKKLEFKRMLLQIKKHLPYVIDVNWRLDFCIRSSGEYYPACPIFFIQIIAEACGNKSSGEIIVKKFNFMCSLQELQELVSKLREATRHVESIANIK
ncbi:COMM domain-containing protein 3 [Lycorma delicatula]|uniref:COMM domain-containing protein 3 n=1 Tax=Lycorma delicatula TaxID=130591 RepID=UPI003F51654A